MRIRHIIFATILLPLAAAILSAQPSTPPSITPISPEPTAGAGCTGSALPDRQYITNGHLYTCTGGIWVSIGGGSGGSPAFNTITSGTNTSAAMVVGSGASLSVSGSGVNNANEINGTALSGLATGILKNTTGTGVPSIGVADTDYAAAPAVLAVMQGLSVGTYTSGGSITGSSTQTCTLTFTGGATATVALTGTNTIAGGTALTITGAGANAVVPTTATLGNGTATCSGTATVAITSVTTTWGSATGYSGFSLAISASVTGSTGPTNMVSGKQYSVAITTDALSASGYTFVAPSNFKGFPTSFFPTPASTAANLYWNCTYDGTNCNAGTNLGWTPVGGVTDASVPAGAPGLGNCYWSTTSLTGACNGTGGRSYQMLNLSSVAHKFVTSWSASVGVLAQPAFSDLSGSATTSQLPLVTLRRPCPIVVGADTNSNPIANGDLGPQKKLCKVPEAGTIVELDIASDSGTPSVIVAVRHCTTFTTGTCSAETVSNIVSGALTANTSGYDVCTNTGGTTGIDSGTTCTNTLQNTSIAAGDYIELVSGTAGGTAKRLSISVIYTVN